VRDLSCLQEEAAYSILVEAKRPVLTPLRGEPDDNSDIETAGPPTEKTFVARVREAWPVRTLAAGAISVAADYAILIILVELGHLAPITASILGVLVGGVVDFVLNKYAAFRNRDPRVGRQAAIFAAYTGVALLIYSPCFYLLTRALHVPYVLAKMAIDVLVFGIGGFLTNRFLVFPAQTPDRPAARGS
jgi:putative flippase GtrA